MIKIVTNTSLKAYIQEKPRLEINEGAVYWAIKKTPNKTDMELLEFLRVFYPKRFFVPNHVRPRRRELVKKGLVLESGKGICTITGKLAKTWRIV